MRHGDTSALPAWIQAGVSVLLAGLTGVYVWLTSSLANVARQQLEAARDERKQAHDRASRSLSFLAQHLLRQVDLLENGSLPIYRRLRECALPRMEREIADLILLSRDARESTLTPHTALSAP